MGNINDQTVVSRDFYSLCNSHGITIPCELPISN
jgi:hypothetical protein